MSSQLPYDVPQLTVAAAARLTGLHPQTLRQYDRLGLVSPERTAGGCRRYSLRHIEEIQRITNLALAGVNREGIRRIVQLNLEVLALRTKLRETLLELEQERARRPGQRVFAADPVGNQVVTVTGGTRVRRSKHLMIFRRPPQ